MQRTTIHKVRDLTSDERRMLESLVGGTFDEDETVIVRCSKGQVIKDAPSGEERDVAFRRLAGRIDETSARAAGVPENDIDAAISEAADYVRHHSE